jgi:hypothetical protein
MNVFISHSESDAAFVTRLAAEMAALGVSVWRADREVLPGDNVWLKVGEALEKADAMVVVLSRRAVVSANVRRDIEFALGSPQFRGRLISLLLEEVEEIPWILERLPVVRVGRRMPARAARLIAAHLNRAREKAG